MSAAWEATQGFYLLISAFSVPCLCLQVEQMSIVETVAIFKKNQKLGSIRHLRTAQES
jgi:hypothetical protein